ncbi:hypothetical protein B0T24DRAFT_521171 [Lasiosphaeria ovina]|uniref:Uncharacterized protein n=1 Tax=Lasiosphaeria ovina TaxID=92902 RepID=A0AAE0KP14_9PEZI|nr:hypothetical protein B0T24DRAFT_521171 [Lasiosphaeria ovina]
MAPIALESEPSYLPLALALSHAAAVVYLSSKVGRSLYRARRELGPAQDTRHRSAQRSNLTIVFASLAALGFVLAATSALSYLGLSYQTWADERGVAVPKSPSELSFWGRDAAGTNATSLRLAYWLSDTPIHLDALEIVAERARRLWWGQQLDVATVSWMTLLAIEGRRRKIPHLWAYALLAHLVGLSFAQNLFYVAMLLTPSPFSGTQSRLERLLNRALPPKPDNWWPKPVLFFVPLTLNYGAIISLPYAVGTASFPVTAVLARALTFAPLVLPAIVPESWGVVYPDPHGVYGTFNKLFQFMSAAGLLMHAKATAVGLWHNMPEAYKHRHSIKIPFDTEKRSKWERSATAVEKVLGSMTDHPAVTGAGRDVLMCGLSLGLWAAVRAMDTGDMLQSIVPGYKAASGLQPTDPTQLPVKAESPAAEGQKQASASSSTALRRRANLSVSSISSSNSPGDEGSQTPKWRGRPRKVKAEPEPDPEDVPGDETYEPDADVRASATLGDVVPDDDFDWEAGSLAWALTALGGLGTGSSAVFGAESISR